MYSAAENTTEIVVTSVAERRIIAKIPIDTRVEVSFNFQFSQLNKKNKLLGSSHGYTLDSPVDSINP